MKLRLKENEGPPPIPEGEFLPAVVESIEERESPWEDADGNKKMRMNFRFKVNEGPYKGRVLFGDVPAIFDTYPGCHLRLWIQEIMGIDDLPVDTEIDTEHLVGLDCTIVVGARTKVIGEEKITKNFVSDVLRTTPAKVVDPF